MVQLATPKVISEYAINTIALNHFYLSFQRNKHRQHLKQRCLKATYVGALLSGF